VLDARYGVQVVSCTEYFRYPRASLGHLQLVMALGSFWLFGLLGMLGRGLGLAWEFPAVLIAPIVSRGNLQRRSSEESVYNIHTVAPYTSFQ
jgi:hypothetical protein